MKHPILTRVAQLIAAVILLVAAIMKFMGDPGSVEVFVLLEMEPTGRYIIATLELAAALLLLSPYAAMGALLAVGVMCGAIIAHTTHLGLGADGGKTVVLLLAVLLSASFVLFSRRKELPLLGDGV